MNNLLNYLASLEKKEYTKKNYSLKLLLESLKFLGNPHEKLKNVIHITGTNGKGSTAIYTSIILVSLGHTTGLYTSPHLFDFTERIQFNNINISYDLVKRYLEEIYYKVPKKIFCNLSYFELLTCIMFLYFCEVQPDFIILETGLGGRLDATNVVPYSIISCITSVSIDHTEVLGKTKFEILKDKSGIIKPNSIFVCGMINERKFCKYLKNLCKKLNTEFVNIPKDVVKNVKLDFCNWTTSFTYVPANTEFVLPLCSIVQPYNFTIALKIVEKLYNYGFVRYLNYKKIAEIVKKTVIPFRMHKVNLDGTTVILDGAHNLQAVENFVSTINLSDFTNITICFTIMKEKDYKNILKMLSKLKNKVGRFIVYTLNLTRNQSLKVIYNEAKKYFKEKVYKFSNCEKLLKYLNKFCKQNKIFFVGSFYAANVVKKWYEKFL